MCGHEDDEITLDVLVCVGTEKPSDNRNISDNRCAVLCLLHVFAHQAAEHDGRAIIDAHAGSNFACAEDRLVNHVLSNDEAGEVMIPPVNVFRIELDGDRIGLP